MLDRFTGTDGPRLIRQAIYEQQCLAHNNDVTDALFTDHILVDFKKDDVLITEGAQDNDLYLILAGRVSIRVKGREVAIRQAGQHVGEMTVIEPSKPRSATVVALETVVAVKVPEPRFAALAERYPYLWRRMAMELTDRLRERHKFVRQPNPRPVIFVGSSVEGLEIARAIQSGLANDDFIVEIWTDNIFTASRGTMQKLEEAVNGADFGVLVCTKDDRIINEDRGIDMSAPRDNVILELGMCIGRLGGERAFFVRPRTRDLKIPTDLLGITPIDYAEGEPKTLAARMGAACTQIRNAVRDQGVR